MKYKKYKKASHKWMAIAEGKDGDGGSGNCPLCQLFGEGNCRDCPVYKDNGVGCIATPWGAWSSHKATVHGDYGGKVICIGCQILALNEWLYLKSIGE